MNAVKKRFCPRIIPLYGLFYYLFFFFETAFLCRCNTGSCRTAAYFNGVLSQPAFGQSGESDMSQQDMCVFLCFFFDPHNSAISRLHSGFNSLVRERYKKAVIKKK